jgi:hypothetical protein
MPESHPLALKTDMKARELNGQPVISIPRQLSPGFHDRLYCQGIAYRRLREPSLIEETGIAYRRDNRSEKIRGFIGFLQGRLRDLAGDVLNESTQGVQQHPGPTQLSLF